MSDDDLSPIARALGRVPTGLYVVTTKRGDEPLGFVGSFVMQQGIDPPVMSVAVGRDRVHLAGMRECGRFALSILDEESQGAMGAFFRKYEGGDTPFDHVGIATTPGGLFVLSDALGWLECAVTGEHDAGDHVIVFGRVEAGEQRREGKPSIHLRKNGLGY